MARPLPPAIPSSLMPAPTERAATSRVSRTGKPSAGSAEGFLALPLPSSVPRAPTDRAARVRVHRASGNPSDSLSEGFFALPLPPSAPRAPTARAATSRVSRTGNPSAESAEGFFTLPLPSAIPSSLTPAQPPRESTGPPVNPRANCPKVSLPHPYPPRCRLHSRLRSAASRTRPRTANPSADSAEGFFALPLSFASPLTTGIDL